MWNCSDKMIKTYSGFDRGSTSWRTEMIESAQVLLYEIKKHYLTKWNYKTSEHCTDYKKVIDSTSTKRMNIYCILYMYILNIIHIKYVYMKCIINIIYIYITIDNRLLNDLYIYIYYIFIYMQTRLEKYLTDILAVWYLYI